jgi:hypothetical protein
VSRPAGCARRALGALLAAGASGTYKALATAAGVPCDQARATLKEMSRCGQAAAARERDGGRAPAIYGAPTSSIDALALVRQAWR